MCAAAVQQLFQQEISSKDQCMMCFAVPCPELMGAKAL